MRWCAGPAKVVPPTWVKVRQTSERDIQRFTCQTTNWHGFSRSFILSVYTVGVTFTRSTQRTVNGSLNATNLRHFTEWRVDVEWRPNIQRFDKTTTSAHKNGARHRQLEQGHMTNVPGKMCSGKNLSNTHTHTHRQRWLKLMPSHVPIWFSANRPL